MQHLLGDIQGKRYKGFELEPVIFLKLFFFQFSDIILSIHIDEVFFLLEYGFYCNINSFNLSALEQWRSKNVGREENERDKSKNKEIKIK